MSTSDEEIDSQISLNFSRQMLDCVVGGVSALDIARLDIQSVEEARQFILAYGYDINDPEQREQLWSTYRRAIALIKAELMEEGEVLPEELHDPARLTDLADLLMIASSRKPEDRVLQRWACAILRVMHVYVHLRNDLFSAFRDEIQSQILKPLQDSIFHGEGGSPIILGASTSDGGVVLHKFDIKPFKTTASSVIKLLARPERVALTLLDKLGVRFVTRNVFDSFRVIRFLVDNHILSYPHIIPDQSNNTLYPVNLFMEVLKEVRQAEGEKRTLSGEEIQQLLKERLAQAHKRAEYLEKSNEFSGPEYRFIKFINRKLITVSLGGNETQRAFRFFYPYEIQVMDEETYRNNLSGPMAHDEYKNRQRKKARDRVLRESYVEPTITGGKKRD